MLVNGGASVLGHAPTSQGQKPDARGLVSDPIERPSGGVHPGSRQCDATDWRLTAQSPTALFGVEAMATHKPVHRSIATRTPIWRRSLAPIDLFRGK